MEHPCMHTTQIPIEIVDAHFFIKWAQTDKRYRISASFKFLNTKYGLHINIIRDLKKVFTSQADNLKFLLVLLNNQEQTYIADSLNFKRYINYDEETIFFLITREYEGTFNQVLVFFSLKYWGLNEYLSNFPTKDI